jgi:succinate dehydrogenase / fumarate reductase cytochrome b subunit
MIDHKNKPRPLSPHLTIYKAEYSSMLSIYHRVTGILLAVCLLLLGLIYKLQGYNIEYFSLFVNIFSVDFLSKSNILVLIINIIVIFIVFAIVFMLSYHMSNGIRHFVWDYILSTVSKYHVKSTSYIVLVLTGLIFICLILPAYF